MKGWLDRLDDESEAAASARSIVEALDAIEDELIVPSSHEDTFGLNERARLNEKLASVISVVASADAKPTQQAMGVANSYAEEIDAQLGKLGTVLDEIPAFNALVKQLDLPAVE